VAVNASDPRLGIAAVVTGGVSEVAALGGRLAVEFGDGEGALAVMKAEAALKAKDGWCDVFALLAARSSSRMLYIVVCLLWNNNNKVNS